MGLESWWLLEGGHTPVLLFCDLYAPFIAVGEPSQNAIMGGTIVC
jgi:hypothetical protein